MKTARGGTPLGTAALVAAVPRAIVAVPLAYLSVVTVSATFAQLLRRRTGPAGAPARTYAVLVPAHDEETVIGETVRALVALDYPTGQRRIEVLADHCTDATPELAAAAGAHVVDRRAGERGKGATIAEAISRLLDEGHEGRRIDAFVIVDADTVVDGAFLRVVDAELDAGAMVVQGQYRVRDAARSPATSLRAIALTLRHHVRPLGRTSLGASCGLFGNGMVFRREVLAGRSWTNHLTEDIELQMELLFDGFFVTYAPAAIVEAEMPSSLEAARSQNERWERGRIELAQRYVPRLLGRARRTRGRARVAALDAALDHLVPPLSVLALATIASSVAGGLLGLVRRGRPARGSLALPLALTVHVASGVVLGRLPWSVVRSLVHAPAMVWWKVGVWTRVLRRGEGMAWVRTEHRGDAG